MKKKIQLMIIHGGNAFRKHEDYLRDLRNRKVSLEKRVNWAGDYLEKKLGPDFQVIRPRMPKQDDAKYEEWKILFERYLPVLDKDIILVGCSLGGIFLARYLSENKISKNILGAFLVCPPFDKTHSSDDDLAGGFQLKSDISLIEKNCPNLTLMFSKDDDCVPVYHAEKYRSKLKKANIIIYESMNGHFNVPEFPEIIKMIKSLRKIS
jgi:predicted alpha/beta hydrolase family esterase